MSLEIRRALAGDVDTVRSILLEAAGWLRGQGMELWEEHELTRELVERDVRSGSVYLAFQDGEPAGTLRLQLADPLMWPDLSGEDSTFVHRLAVRRRYAGGRLSFELLRWAARHTAELGRRVLRLDCAQDRAKLRSMYERFGFRWHSDRRVGPFHVARYEYAVGSEAEHPAPGG